MSLNFLNLGTTFYFLKKCFKESGSIRSKGKNVYRAHKLFRKNSTIVLLTSIFLTLSGFIGALTYYGQQVGNFVISIDNKAAELGLILSEDKEFAYSSPRLIGGSLNDVRPVAYDQIVKEYVLEEDGTYVSNAGNYMGYSFYLKNNGEETVSVEAIMNISRVTRYVDEAVRIWVFNDELKTNGTIYQKADKVDAVYPVNYPDTENFLNDTTVFKEQIVSLHPEESIRYTLIFWIEGYDPDCTDKGEYSILKGSIRFGLNFKIIEELEN